MMVKRLVLGGVLLVSVVSDDMKAMQGKRAKGPVGVDIQHLWSPTWRLWRGVRENKVAFVKDFLEKEKFEPGTLALCLLFACIQGFEELAKCLVIDFKVSPKFALNSPGSKDWKGLFTCNWQEEVISMLKSAKIVQELQSEKCLIKGCLVDMAEISPLFLADYGSHQSLADFLIQYRSELAQ